MSHIEEQDHPPGSRPKPGVVNPLDGVLQEAGAKDKEVSVPGQSGFQELRPE
jgi:hypothetical protein